MRRTGIAFLAMAACHHECPVDGEWASGAEFKTYTSSGDGWVGVATSSDATCAFGAIGNFCWSDLPTTLAIDDTVTIAKIAMSPAGSWAAALTTDGALLMFDPAHPEDGTNGFAGGPYKDQWAGSLYRCQILEADDAAACGPTDTQDTVGPQGVSFVRAVGDDQGRFCGIAFDHTVACWDESGAAVDGGFGDARYQALDGARGWMCATPVDPGPPVCFGQDVADLPAPAEDACAPPSGDFASIAVGDKAACAIDASGVPICWTGTDLLPVPADTTFASLSVAFEHACGIDTGGHIVCFGKKTDAIVYMP